MTTGMPKRLTVRLTTDEIEATIWAVTNFTSSVDDCGNAEMFKLLRSSKVALIAAMKVATAKTQRKDPRNGKA